MAEKCAWLKAEVGLVVTRGGAINIRSRTAWPPRVGLSERSPRLICRFLAGRSRGARAAACHEPTFEGTSNSDLPKKCIDQMAYCSLSFLQVASADYSISSAMSEWIWRMHNIYLKINSPAATIGRDILKGVLPLLANIGDSRSCPTVNKPPIQI